MMQRLAERYGAFAGAGIVTLAIAILCAAIAVPAAWLSESPVPFVLWFVCLVPVLAVYFISYLLLDTLQARTTDQARIHQLNVSDEITGLLSRTQFEHCVKREIERGVRHQTLLTILLIDIRHFHQLNRQLGRAAGNFVLQNLADMCCAATRDLDFVCRYSGGQLALILPQTSTDEAHHIALRLLGLIDAKTPVFDHRPLVISLAVGGAQASGEEIIDVDGLINRAELALAQVQQSSDDRIILFDEHSAVAAEECSLAKAS